jgi:hypothetical protein
MQMLGEAWGGAKPPTTEVDNAPFRVTRKKGFRPKKGERPF